MSVKLLTEHNLELLCLKGGYTGSSESSHVTMPHCWKSPVTAHLYDVWSGLRLKDTIDLNFQRWADTSCLSLAGPNKLLSLPLAIW